MSIGQADALRLGPGVGWRTRWRLWRRGRFAGRPPFWMTDGLDVGTNGQPELMALVDEVAGRVGVAPGRVVIVGDATARAWIGRRDQLLAVGLPLLLRLTRDELRALIAHELSTFAVPDARLWAVVRRERESATISASISAMAELSIVDPRPVRHLRRGAAILRETQPLADAVESAVDRAAVGVAGAPVLARALARAEVIDTDFQAMVHDLWPSEDVGIIDVYDAWLTRLHHGRTVPVFWYATKVKALEAQHPILASLIAALSPGDLDLTKPANPIAVAPFDQADQRRLAAHASFGSPTQWMTLAEIPSHVWETTTQSEADELVARIAKVLHRQPDTAEVIDVLATRMAELYATDGNRHLSDPDEVRAEAEGAVLAFAEDRLTRQGWRRQHPAVEGLLVGSASAELDILPLARRCLTDAAARSELASLVAG